MATYRVDDGALTVVLARLTQFGVSGAICPERVTPT
jgi:hypothetical protein